MKKYDLISGCFLLLVSLVICIGSLQLEIGALNAPGSGFYPLVTGLSLGVFSILIMLQARKEGGPTVQFWAPGANKKGIAWSFFIILVYALLLEDLGFLGTGIIFFVFVSRFVSGHRWKSAFIFALVATFATYTLFKYLLHAPLPQGILKGVF